MSDSGRDIVGLPDSGLGRGKREVMRASEQEQTGGAGTHEVMAKFERIGWGPVRNDAHDLGTDLLVEARDGRRFQRGLIVGVQVKAGRSWFEDEERDADGSLLGWWYYEPDTEHFDDWVTHGLPHLLALHDLDQDVSYWVHVTADRVTRTGKGCKILVPAAQTVDVGQVDDLMLVAARQKAAPAVEGTAFAASAQTIPPGRRLRHALIAPRLVAPHRNAGHDRAIGPEEAAALIAQGRLVDLERFAEAHGSVPAPGGHDTQRDWRWSFVRAFWKWALEGATDPLRLAADEAPDSPSEAAAVVVLACALLREERHEDALRVLDGVVARDELGPVDLAWVLVQRARVRADIGDIPAARTDGVDAQRQLVGDANDVTVSAIASAAAWQLFTTAGELSERGIGEVMSASDTAVSWWRSQTIAWALDEASTRVFRDWSGDQTQRWSVEDSEAVNLFGAELNADVTGEHGTWRAISSLGARHRLMRSDPGDAAAAADALDILRRSGDADSLKLAAVHLWRVGPSVGVAGAINRIGAGSWTHTAAKANFDFWSVAGDLVKRDAATSATAWCTQLLEGGAADFSRRIQARFLVELAAAEAIESLLPASDPSAHETVATLFVGRAEPMADILAGPLARIAGILDVGQFSDETRQGLLDFAIADHGRVGAAALGVLADSDDDIAKSEVMARAAAGDLHALAAMGAITVLSDEAAEQLIVTFEGMVKAKVQQASQGMWTVGEFDGAHGLALFNLWFPGIARWKELVTLLGDQAVAPGDKRGAANVIVALADRIPEDVRAMLADVAGSLGTTPDHLGLGGRPIGGLGVNLAVAVGALDGPDAEAAVARLALGSSQERSDAARLLGLGGTAPMRPLLASLLADQDVDVRAAAARAVGRLVASTPADAVLVTLGARASDDQGVVVPSAFVGGVAQSSDAVPEHLRKLLDPLRAHPAATVRLTVERVLGRP